MRVRAWSLVLVGALVLGVGAPPVHAQPVEWVDRVPDGTGLAIDVFKGGVYVAGVAHGTAHLRAYTLDGALRWAARVGPAKGDEAYGVAAGRSGVYVAGITNGVFPGEHDGRGSDAFLAKYDHAGRFAWARQIAGKVRVHADQCTGEDMVCPDWEQAFGVAVSGKAVYVVGRMVTQLGGATERQNGFIQRYDVNGDLGWTRAFRQAGWNVDATKTAVYVTSFLTPQVRRFDPDGSLVWTRAVDKNAEMNDVAAAGGSVYLAGGVNSDGGVWRLRPNGSVCWSTTTGARGWDGFNGITAKGSEVYVVGFTHGRLPDQLLAGGDRDLLIAVLGRDGDMHRIVQIGGPRGEQGRGIAVSNRSLFVTSGTSGRFLDLPPMEESMLVLALER
jgi:hypothetical protein